MNINLEKLKSLAANLHFDFNDEQYERIARRLSDFNEKFEQIAPMILNETSPTSYINDISYSTLRDDNYEEPKSENTLFFINCKKFKNNFVLVEVDKK